MYFQAIAHYEQSADYYKGEESNRYVPFFISVTGFSSLSSEHLCGSKCPQAMSLQYCHLLCTVLLSALLTNVCWRWQPMLHSWSSIRKPSRSTSRWRNCCHLDKVCNSHYYLLLKYSHHSQKKLGKTTCFLVPWFAILDPFEYCTIYSLWLTLSFVIVFSRFFRL